VVGGINQTSGSPLLRAHHKQYFWTETIIRWSHIIFKTQWKGGPRINIQKNGNKEKAYSVGHNGVGLNVHYH